MAYAFANSGTLAEGLVKLKLVCTAFNTLPIAFPPFIRFQDVSIPSKMFLPSLGKSPLIISMYSI